MKKAVIWAILLISGTAFAQSSGRYDSNAWVAADNVPIGAQAPIFTVPYATVTICTDSSCATPVNVYSDQALTQLITQPLQADAFGKYGFWVTPGTYWATECSPAGDCNSGYVTIGSGSGGGGSTSLALTTTGSSGASTLSGNPSAGYTLNVPVYSGGGGSGPTLQTNSVNNSSQSLLNLEAGTNMTITNTSGGNVLFSSVNGTTLPPPFPVPNGQAVAWAYPTACTAGPAVASTNGYAICGPQAGFVAKYFSSPLGNCCWTAEWNGFVMPTLPSDAVIQGVYGVEFVQHLFDQGTATGITQANCTSGATLGLNIPADGINYTGEFWTTASLGATSATVTGASCELNVDSSLGPASLFNVNYINQVAIAIYYTTATPPPLLPYQPVVSNIQLETNGTANGNQGLLNLAAGTNITLHDDGTGDITVNSTAGSVTWPVSADLVISNSTNSPAGLAPISGDCVVGASGAWTAAACPTGGTGISGGTTGFLPLFGSATTITAPAHMDDSVTSASTLTATEKIASPAFAGTGSDPFFNLPNNTGHSYSAGDLANDAGVLQFNDGTATRTVVTQLTTTGSSGAATLSGGVLNVPVYSGGGGAVSQLAQTVVSGSSTTTITLGSISGSYTQLHLVINAQSSDVSADTLILRFNGDSGSNYDGSSIFMSTGSAVSAASSTAQTSISLSGGTPTVASRAVSLDCALPSYSGTTFFKNIQCSSAGWAGTTFLQLVTTGGDWRNTSAITSLTLSFGSGDHFLAGSTVTLYGEQ